MDWSGQWANKEIINMKIGILGGAFNPPHLGHLILAQNVLSGLGLDKIFFIPTNISPHKESNNVGATERLEMLKLTVADNENFQVLDLEMKRGGTSYTIDTVKELKTKYPDDDFYLIVGSDLANDFFTWKDYQQLKKLIAIAVACRNNYPLKEKDNFILLDIAQFYISSSQIRQLIKQGHCIRHLVKDSVADYIEKHNLYAGKELE